MGGISRVEAIDSPWRDLSLPRQLAGLGLKERTLSVPPASNVNTSRLWRASGPAMNVDSHRPRASRNRLNVSALPNTQIFRNAPSRHCGAEPYLVVHIETSSSSVLRFVSPLSGRFPLSSIDRSSSEGSVRRRVEVQREPCSRSVQTSIRTTKNDLLSWNFSSAIVSFGENRTQAMSVAGVGPMRQRG